MKITVLAENKGRDGLTAEHGLSLYVEHEGKKYLIDTGAGDAFYRNAQLLDIDLRDVDAAFISHAHNDHAGGLAFFLSWNKKARVFMGAEAASASCWKIQPDSETFIGIPEHFISSFEQRYSFVEGANEVLPRIWMLPHSTPGLAQRGKRACLFVKNGEDVVPDDFSHEYTVVFDTDEGTVVFSSCSHAGADNVVKEVMEALPGKKVRAFLGGFHVMGPGGVETLGMPESEVRELADSLRSLDIGKIYTGHCTGDPGFAILKDELGDALSYMSTGTVIEI